MNGFAFVSLISYSEWGSFCFRSVFLVCFWDCFIHCSGTEIVGALTSTSVHTSNVHSAIVCRLCTAMKLSPGPHLLSFCFFYFCFYLRPGCSLVWPSFQSPLYCKLWNVVHNLCTSRLPRSCFSCRWVIPFIFYDLLFSRQLLVRWLFNKGLNFCSHKYAHVWNADSVLFSLLLI